MFNNKSANNTAANKIITEGTLLDNLSELATACYGGNRRSQN